MSTVRPRTVSGMRPTGPLHLGHYFGVLKNWVELQHTEEAYFFVADWHALTSDYADPSNIATNVEEMVKDWVAAGLDPEKSTIFIQSQIPELCELSFYYMNLVTVSRLQRNPTVKNEIQMRGFKQSIPVGFFTYPISQAADITAFKANIVPVGEDQLPMIEQTREIVRSFNTTYREVLVEPTAVLPENSTCSRLPGLDGAAKMSKSLGNCIYLSDSSNDIKKKVQSMFTDPTHLHVEDPGHTENNPVFIYLDAFCRDEHFGAFLPAYQNLDELKAHYQRGGLGDGTVKKFLNEILQNELRPIREKRELLAQDLGEIFRMLEAGSRTAEAVAAKTLSEVKTAMGINYFNGNELPR